MFENITPEDFFRETSAVRRVAVPPHVKDNELHHTSSGFEGFIRAHVTECRRLATQNKMVPLAWLANMDEHRLFHGEDDEVPADFARRLHREATQMNAHWSFVALIAPARAILPGQTEPPMIDPDDLSAVREGIESGQLSVGICWTAGSVDNGPLEYRGGIIYLDMHGQPGDQVEGEMDSDIEDPFTQVLNPRD